MDSEIMKIKLLNNENWHSWCTEIKVLLLDRGSWEFIEKDEEPKLPEGASTREVRDHEMRKNRAYTTIYYSVQPEYRELIAGTTNGKEAYGILKTHFQPKTRARIIALLDEFFSLRFERGHKTIRLFAAKLKTAAQRLQDAGQSLDELFKGFQLIRYLPPEFNGIAQIIYRWKDEDFKFEKIVNELILEEDCLKQIEKDSQTEQVAYSITRPFKSSQKRKPKQYKSSQKIKNKSNDKKYQKGQCYVCGSKSHYMNACPQAKKSTNLKTVQAPNVELLNNTVNEVKDTTNWCLDSGATHHFSNNRKLFSSFRKLNETKMALAVGGAESVVEGEGTINFKVPGNDKMFILRGVMYSPNLRRNLLSMSKIDDIGGHFHGENGKMWIYNKNSEKLFYAKKINGLYILKPSYPRENISETTDCQNLNTTSQVKGKPSTPNTKVVKKNKNTSSHKKKSKVKREVNVPTDTQKEVDLWHRRFCHANIDYLIKTSKNNSVDGLPLLTQRTTECIPCKLAKTKRVSFKSIGKIRSTKPLQMLHMDLCGPLPEKSQQGHLYFLTITDDYSRKVTVFPQYNKTEVFDTFLRFKRRAENFLDLKIKTIRTDSGLEFCHRKFSSFLNEFGIKHERTNFYSPEMNGTSERYNLTVLDGIKAMLKESGQPNKFWSEAILCFTYVWNRVCHKGQTKTPFELYSKHKPSVKHLKPFGCRVYVGVPRQKRHKFDMRAKLGTMMGYAQQTKGYRIWLQDDQKIIETKNVTFSETELMSGSILGQNDEYLTIRRESISDNSDDEVVEYEPPALKSSTDLVWSREIVERSDGSRKDVYYKLEGKQARFKSVKDIEKFCTEQKIVFQEDLFDFSAKNLTTGVVVPLSNESVAPEEEPIEAQQVQLKVPGNFKEALNSPEKHHWQKAMDDEISVMKDRKVWDLVPLPKDTKILGNRWVYTIKKNDQGEVTRFKARLVAKGFNQVQGETYDEVFSPVVSFTLVRLFFTIFICSLKWMHCQLDIKNAYLYASLNYKIYMHQPQGYQMKEQEDHVCCLNRSLYGLHQSGRDWYFELDKELRTLGFERIKWSNCIYTYKNKILLLVYVDDIVIFGKTQADVDFAVRELKSLFDIKILGKTTKLLGIEFLSKGDSLYLHQNQYITQICQKFSEYEYTISSLPMAKGQPISKLDCPSSEAEKAKMSKIPYRSLLGCLSFLASRTRPDICFAVNLLSQYQENPGEKHWKVLLKLLGYVKYTNQYMLKLRKEDPFILNCFSDADFATSRDNRVSMGGMFFQLGTSPISWRTFKHKCVSLSTMEAEYISLSEAAKELIWISKILEECKHLGISVDSSNLFCDNKSAIDFARSPVENNRTKHIDVRFHFIRQHVYLNDFKLRYICTSDNMSDIFTKSLSKHYLLKFSNLVFNI